MGGAMKLEANFDAKLELTEIVFVVIGTVLLIAGIDAWLELGLSSFAIMSPVVIPTWYLAILNLVGRIKSRE
jgi:hypothetical protein